MTLHELATRAGLAVHWKDVRLRWHQVGDDTLRLVLAALGLPAGTDAEIEASGQSMDHPAELPPLVTADVGGTIRLPVPPGEFEFSLELGGVEHGQASGEHVAEIVAPAVPGYHKLRIGGAEIIVAVAPTSCWTVADAMPSPAWGVAVQLYALRRSGDAGLGDFGGLADFVRNAAAHNVAAVAISPVHAQFAATSDRFSPYSPSSRTLLNVLHARLDLEGDEAARLEAMDFVDWPAATALRLACLDAMYEAAKEGGPLWDEFLRFRDVEGATLEGHARFEALHAAMTKDGGPWQWRHWPNGLANAHGPEVAAFAVAHADEISRHAFRQFIADRSLGEAQVAARQAGMPIGLISDLAVGVDAGGSQCWARADQTLIGLSVGAPPDLLNARGQSWGLAAFSPRGLQLHGFGAYIEMLRAAMRHSGGVRIDHAMGLARLWVLPDGASPDQGVYLHFPVDDMLRLIRLESYRHRAIVLGEDLGTFPDGFQAKISDAGMLGMRVLWFERAADLGFTAPAIWDHGAVSMTSTHDLPTVAGWWGGNDIAWRHRVGHLDQAGVDREEGERHRDRSMLWAAMTASGAVQGDLPPPHEPAEAVSGAIRHVAGAGCAMTIIPIEDVLGLVEQPNLPGTLDEHPNWRRRMAAPASSLLDDPVAAGRLRDIDAARKSA